jgi:hypothetical protein
MKTQCRDENSMKGAYLLLRLPTHKTHVNTFPDAFYTALGDWNELQNDLSSGIAVGVYKILVTSHGVNMTSHRYTDRIARMLSLQSL